jgi:hypothetical protein
MNSSTVSYTFYNSSSKKLKRYENKLWKTMWISVWIKLWISTEPFTYPLQCGYPLDYEKFY